MSKEEEEEEDDDEEEEEDKKNLFTKLLNKMEEEGEEEEEEEGHASPTIFGIKVIKSSCWGRLGCITYAEWKVEELECLLC